MQAGVRHQYRGAYAKAIHEWQHWWAKNKHDRRKLIAPHERRFVADKENARKQILEYHEQKRRYVASTRGGTGEECMRRW